jgi:hypothetical protein
MKLGLTIPLGDTETPRSFASRLGAANGLDGRVFCSDWELKFQDALDGDKKTIAAIAELGGVDATTLMLHAFVRQNAQHYEHRGQMLTRSTLRLVRVFICPACALEDIAALPHLKPYLAVHGRSPWVIDVIKTCPDHNRGLVNITAATPHVSPEFVPHVRAAVPKLATLLADTPSRVPSGFETYVLKRLEGRSQFELLDDLPLYAALRTCEMLGAVALFGPRPPLKTLRDDQLLLANALGFDIAKGGQVPIRSFLDELLLAVGTRDRKDGPSVVLGGLYWWLTRSIGDTAYDPIRKIVSGHIRENFPLAAGSSIFGETIPSRTLHSIRTLSLETGQHPKKLRKALRASEIVRDDQTGRSDHNVVFDAAAGSSVARDVKSCLALPAVQDYLNAPRVQADLLIKHGFIKPHLSRAQFGAREEYAIQDLDKFLDRLTRHALVVHTPASRQVTIPQAAKLACCSAADIVRLILENELPWVGRLRKDRGYLSVVVNIDDVKRAMRGPDHGGVSLRQVAQRLCTNDRVVTALITQKHLATFTAKNPVNRCMQTLVTPKELERFLKTYVSLHVLAKERKQFGAAVKKDLEAAGTRPAFDLKKVFARFYRRSDLQGD